MKQLSALVYSLFLLCFLMVYGCQSKEEPERLARIEQGKRHYVQYCELCHASDGKGYQADGANALSHQEFLRIASDELLRSGIEQGRVGSTMSAWGKAYGGPLSSEGIESLVAFIRSWQTLSSLDVDEKKIEGGPLRGQVQYDIYCKSCHGVYGRGGSYMSISDPNFLSHASDGYLEHSIAKGRPGTPMNGYETTLRSQEISDLVALIRSWQREGTRQTVELPSSSLGEPFLDPKGFAPSFKQDGQFVNLDTLKSAYDTKAKFILLDARPAGDYVENHIKGARSVPFYAVSKYLDQLPKDYWIVTYCACPHAESGAAADALRNNGYTKVKVFNEGYRVWKEKGYPIQEGVSP